MATVDGLEDGAAPGRVRRAVTWLTVLSALLAVATALLVTLIPSGTSVSTVVDYRSGTPVTTTETTRVSLYDHDGSGVLVIAMVPAALAAIPLVARRSVRARRRVQLAVTLAVGMFVLLGALSIGLAYVPTLLVMVGVLIVIARQEQTVELR